jgi:dimethylaniline monooxygenase (N-oxide forming)
MKGTEIKLADNTTITSEAVIFATGWSNAYETIFDRALAVDLELSIPLSEEPSSHKAYWDVLDKSAEQKVLASYPLLRNPPENLRLELRDRSTTPLRHLRFIVPPGPASRGDRNIAFLGNLHSGFLTTHAEVSALWTYAYLEDALPSPSKAPLSTLLNDRRAMDDSIAAQNAYFKLRYRNLLDITITILEQREVIDLYLLDLGLRADRHGRKVTGLGWWGWKAWCREWFTPYFCKDYEGIIGEYLEIVGKQK